MLVIQILLVTAVVVLALGVFAIYSIVWDIRKYIIQTNGMLSKHLKGLFGGYYEADNFDVANDVRRIAEFAEDARKGFIPNLRYDDWRPTEEDITRWEHADIMNAAGQPR